MKIEYNEKEIAAMAEFHKGNRAEDVYKRQVQKEKTVVDCYQQPFYFCLMCLKMT